jgi:ubiquinone/menaquinone biosynthesis C-methylase UbiE
MGSAEAIPLSDESVDLVFISMIFHHLEDPLLAARECRRVLRKQGICFMRTGTYENIPLYPYVDFFPATRPILKDRLPKGSFVREVFTAAGFREIGSEVVTQEVAPNFAVYAEKLAAGADSILISLSPEDFAAGMKALRSHAENVTDQKVFEPIDVFVFQ